MPTTITKEEALWRLFLDSLWLRNEATKKLGEASANASNEMRLFGHAVNRLRKPILLDKIKRWFRNDS